jgi:hypothetical protein
LQQEINIQISRKGKAIFHKFSNLSSPLSEDSQLTSDLEATSSEAPQLRLQHDRIKTLPISPTEAHPFLQKLGIQTKEGRIK